MALLRLIRIFFLLLKAGAFWRAKGYEQRLTKLLPSFGPSFVKLGQMLSVRPDIVGVELAAALTHLQDKLPAYSGVLAKRVIESELGKPLEQLYQSFEDKAHAAASIAQVHRAITLDGKQVAVKVLRPNITRAFEKDIALLYAMARHLGRYRALRRLKLMEVVDMFADTVKKELDLRFEAAAASKLKQNCADDRGIRVPAVHWHLTSQRVLTLDWVEGIPITDKPALLEAGHDLQAIAEQLSVTFFNQTYRDGFFHADLHPGNVFVDSKGDIVLVDFGIMGRLDHETKLYVALILKGFLDGDYDFVAKLHFDASYVPSDQSPADFALACRAIGEPIIGLAANQISIANLLALLFKISEDFNMETQPQLLLLQKTMVLVEGIGQELYPQVNMWQLAEPWMKQWWQEHYSVQAKTKESIKELSSLIGTIPQKVRQFEKMVNMVDENGVRLHPETIRQMRQQSSKKSKIGLLPFGMGIVTGWLVFLLIGWNQ